MGKAQRTSQTSVGVAVAVRLAMHRLLRFATVEVVIYNGLRREEIVPASLNVSARTNMLDDCKTARPGCQSSECGSKHAVHQRS